MCPLVLLILGFTGALANMVHSAVALANTTASPGAVLQTTSCTNLHLKPDVVWTVTLHHDERCQGSCLDLWGGGVTVCSNMSDYTPWPGLTTWGIPRGYHVDQGYQVQLFSDGDCQGDMLDWMDHHTPLDICYESKGRSANSFRVLRMDGLDSAVGLSNSTAEVSAAASSAPDAPPSPPSLSPPLASTAPKPRDATDNTPPIADTDPLGWYFELHQHLDCTGEGLAIWGRGITYEPCRNPNAGEWRTWNTDPTDHPIGRPIGIQLYATNDCSGSMIDRMNYTTDAGGPGRCWVNGGQSVRGYRIVWGGAGDNSNGDATTIDSVTLAG